MRRCIVGKKVKSAFEIASERLGITDPSRRQALTSEQKESLAEIDRKYEAKVAERKILADSEMMQLARSGKFEDVEKVKQRLVVTLGELEEEKKREKEKVRSQKG
jgi:hypothetical protein